MTHVRLSYHPWPQRSGTFLLPPTSEGDLVGFGRLTTMHRRTTKILTKMDRSKRLIIEYVQVLCLHISGSIYLNLCATVQQICDPVLAGLRPFVHHLQSRSRIHGSGRRRYCRPAQLILHRHLLSNSAISEQRDNNARLDDSRSAQSRH